MFGNKWTTVPTTSTKPTNTKLKKETKPQIIFHRIEKVRRKMSFTAPLLEKLKFEEVEAGCKINFIMDEKSLYDFYLVNTEDFITKVVGEENRENFEKESLITTKSLTVSNKNTYELFIARVFNGNTPEFDENGEIRIDITFVDIAEGVQAAHITYKDSNPEAIMQEEVVVEEIQQTEIPEDIIEEDPQVEELQD